MTRDMREVFITQTGELSSDKRHDRGVCHSGGAADAAQASTHLPHAEPEGH